MSSDSVSDADAESAEAAESTEETTEETTGEPTNAAEPAEVANVDEAEVVDETPDRDTADMPLRVEDLRKSFGGITAVDGASFGVERGTVTGLIGPNGAGKSTTFNLITGFHEPDSGHVYFNGEDVTGFRPHRLADRGLVRTFQIARELSDMTVLENLMLAPKGQAGETLWRSVAPGSRGDVIEQEEELLERAWEMLDFFDIAHVAEEYAGNLSGGQRKLLEMARALMTDPEMLLLDEPFAGVNPTLEEKLLEHIHELRREGYTFLLVEHDIDLIMENCEHVIVLHQGKILAEGEPEAIKSDERVIEAYLGGEV